MPEPLFRNASECFCPMQAEPLLECRQSNFRAFGCMPAGGTCDCMSMCRCGLMKNTFASRCSHPSPDRAGEAEVGMLDSAFVNCTSICHPSAAGSETSQERVQHLASKSVLSTVV